MGMRSMSYEKYFGEMDLTEEQTEERLLFALRFEDSVLKTFSKAEMLHGFDELNNITVNSLSGELADSYKELYSEFYELDEEMNNYIDIFTLSVLSTILNRFDDEYQTSYDRARLIAENEANTSLNHVDYKRAIADGCTKKTWVTMKDKNVRQDHWGVDDRTIPIDDYFLVGSSLMKYPKDMTGINVTGEQTVNCRCTVEYK